MDEEEFELNDDVPETNNMSILTLEARKEVLYQKLDLYQTECGEFHDHELQEESDQKNSDDEQVRVPTLDIETDSMQVEDAEVTDGRTAQQTADTGGPIVASVRQQQYEEFIAQAGGGEDRRAVGEGGGMDEPVCVPVPTPATCADAGTYPVGALPTVSLLLQFDQVMTQRILQYLIEWFRSEYVDEENVLSLSDSNCFSCGPRLSTIQPWRMISKKNALIFSRTRLGPYPRPLFLARVN